MNRYELHKTQRQETPVDPYYQAYHKMQEVMDRFRSVLSKSPHYKFMTRMSQGESSPIAIIIDDELTEAMSVIYDDVAGNKFTFSFKISSILNLPDQKILDFVDEDVAEGIAEIRKLDRGYE